MPLRRDTLLDASLASLAAGVHLAMAGVADRWPPELDFSVLFVVLPAVLAGVAALVLLVNGDRRPLQVACVYAWLMVLFTLPAQWLGVHWLPTAAVLTFALMHPAVSSDRSAAG